MGEVDKNPRLDYIETLAVDNMEKLHRVSADINDLISVDCSIQQKLTDVYNDLDRNMAIQCKMYSDLFCEMNKDKYIVCSLRSETYPKTYIGKLLEIRYIHEDLSNITNSSMNRYNNFAIRYEVIGSDLSYSLKFTSDMYERIVFDKFDDMESAKLFAELSEYN